MRLGEVMENERDRVLEVAARVERDVHEGSADAKWLDQRPTE